MFSISMGWSAKKTYLVMSEVWCQIIECPTYWISDQGRVFSTQSGKILKAQLGHKDYLQVQMYGLSAGRVSRKIHRLVAEAFIGTRPDGMEICHRDGNKNNNSISNLRYDTSAGNTQDSLTAGNLGRKLDASQVMQILELLEDGLPVKEIASRYQVSGENIRKIRRRQIWRHLSLT